MSDHTPGSDDPQQGDGSKYGTAAYQAAGDYGTVVERPRQLRMLRNLTIASVVLYVIYSVISGIIATDETVIEESMRQTGMLTDAQIEEALEGAVVWGLVTTIGLAVLAVALYVVVLIGVALAKNWGRIVGIVLAIVGGLFTLFGLVTSFGNMDLIPGLTIASAVITVIWLAVTVWWLVVAFSAPVRRYFAAPRQSRV